MVDILAPLIRSKISCGLALCFDHFLTCTLHCKSLSYFYYITKLVLIYIYYCYCCIETKYMHIICNQCESRFFYRDHLISTRRKIMIKMSSLIKLRIIDYELVDCEYGPRCINNTVYVPAFPAFSRNLSFHCLNSIREETQYIMYSVQA
jgi:hypothetical protein